MSDWRVPGWRLLTDEPEIRYWKLALVLEWQPGVYSFGSFDGCDWYEEDRDEGHEWINPDEETMPTHWLPLLAAPQLLEVKP